MVEPRRERLLIYDACRAVGGAHTSLAALIPELLLAGHEVEVVVTCDAARGAITRRLPEADRARVTIETMRAGLAHQTRGVGYVSRELLRTSWLIRRAARRGAPTRWLNNNGPQVNAAGALAARLLGVPLGQYVRGQFYTGPLAARLLSSAEVALTVGEGARACVEEASPGVATSAVGEGLDLARLSHRGRDARGVLWAASLVRWKGCALALAAHAALGSEAPPMRMCYLPADDAEDADALPTPAPAGVSYHADPPDLDAIRASCDVFVHTSMRPEPYGRAVLEAMAAGLCVIVPDDMSSDLVRHGETGLVYEAGDIWSLTRTLRMATTDRALARGLGEAAARRAAELAAKGVAFAPVLEWVGASAGS